MVELALRVGNQNRDLEHNRDGWVRNPYFVYPKPCSFRTRRKSEPNQWYDNGSSRSLLLYREDYEVAEQYETEEDKNDFYTRIKSGAETGWDFSSRWFIAANGSNRGMHLYTCYGVYVWHGIRLYYTICHLPKRVKKNRWIVRCANAKHRGRRFEQYTASECADLEHVVRMDGFLGQIRDIQQYRSILADLYTRGEKSK